jgi:hypothetical protein
MKKSDLRKVLVKALEQLDNSEAPEEVMDLALEYFGDQEPGVDPKQFWDKD